MSGIEKRLGQLYQELGPQLRAYLCRRHPEPGSADDLLQETFLAALKNAAAFAAARSPKAYLFGIARHVSLDRLRETATEKLRAAPVPVPEAAHDPRLEQMREAISHLKPEFREVLDLRLQGELSYEEIAQALQIPIGTVRSRLHHSIRELRRKVLRSLHADISTSKENEL